MLLRAGREEGDRKNKNPRSRRGLSRKYDSHILQIPTLKFNFYNFATCSTDNPTTMMLIAT
jgi:hypothetical protein